MTRFLILDCYDANGRKGLAAARATPAGELYRDMLLRHRPDAVFDIAFPADADAAIDLTGYDALLWTGSSLTIYEPMPQVTRQVELAREAYRRGIPAFGSCWALQIACVAAGGTCRKNPKGREFGLTRKITLTEAGRAHALFAGRDYAFDGFTSLFDEVESLPAGAVALAGNAATEIQAADISHDKGRFIALQYHPEFDFSVMAALTRFRDEGLIAEARMKNPQDIQDFIEKCEEIDKTPNDFALRFALGADDDVLDRKIRENEFANWLQFGLAAS